jgi:hypothetical protein
VGSRHPTGGPRLSWTQHAHHHAQLAQTSELRVRFERCAIRRCRISRGRWSLPHRTDAGGAVPALCRRRAVHPGGAGGSRLGRGVEFMGYVPRYLASLNGKIATPIACASSAAGAPGRNSRWSRGIAASTCPVSMIRQNRDLRPSQRSGQNPRRTPPTAAENGTSFHVQRYRRAGPLQLGVGRQPVGRVGGLLGRSVQVAHRFRWSGRALSWSDDRCGERGCLPLPW